MTSGSPRSAVRSANRFKCSRVTGDPCCSARTRRKYSARVKPERRAFASRAATTSSGTSRIRISVMPPMISHHRHTCSGYRIWSLSTLASSSSVLLNDSSTDFPKVPQPRSSNSCSARCSRTRRSTRDRLAHRALRHGGPAPLIAASGSHYRPGRTHVSPETARPLSSARNLHKRT